MLRNKKFSKIKRKFYHGIDNFRLKIKEKLI